MSNNMTSFTSAASDKSGNVAARRPLPTLRPARYGLAKKSSAKNLSTGKKKKPVEPIELSSSSSEDEDKDDSPPGRYACPAQNCDETFGSIRQRIAHARAHEHDADQEHLAVYFYCTVPNSNCTYARNVFDDTRAAGLVRRDQMATHMRRCQIHAGMTEPEIKAERALIVERTRRARLNVGLSPISADHEPLPPHGAAMLPPNLP